MPRFSRALRDEIVAAITFLVAIGLLVLIVSTAVKVGHMIGGVAGLTCHPHDAFECYRSVSLTSCMS
jgi:hypothetical protein